jgi:hypothetical protein
LSDKPKRSQVGAESSPERRRHGFSDPDHDGGQDQSLADAKQGHRHGNNPAAGCLGYGGKSHRPQGDSDGHNHPIGKAGSYLSVDEGRHACRARHGGNKQADLKCAGYAEAFQQLGQKNDDGIQKDVAEKHQAIDDQKNRAVLKNPENRGADAGLLSGLLVDCRLRNGGDGQQTDGYGQHVDGKRKVPRKSAEGAADQRPDDPSKTLCTSPPSHDPVAFVALVHVQDQHVDAGEDAGQCDSQTGSAEQQNPEGADQQTGAAGKTKADQCDDIRPPRPLAVDEAAHQRAGQGHKQPVGGDDQSDRGGCDTQRIAHQIQYRGNDASGHYGQAGRSEDDPQGEFFRNSHNQLSISSARGWSSVGSAPVRGERLWRRLITHRLSPESRESGIYCTIKKA